MATLLGLTQKSTVSMEQSIDQLYALSSEYWLVNGEGIVINPMDKRYLDFVLNIKKLLNKLVVESDGVIDKNYSAVIIACCVKKQFEVNMSKTLNPLVLKHNPNFVTVMSNECFDQALEVAKKLIKFYTNSRKKNKANWEKIEL